MTTLTELQQLLHEKFEIDVAAIPPGASMQDSGLDSLAVAEYMFAVEDHFHITLPDDDPDIRTLEQLADLVDRIRTSGPSTPPATRAPAVAPPATALSDEP
jgi:acyl carrier protein